MDLDDEELEATRRLNGVAKKSNIERTDINVGSIEKDIKRCEQLIKEVENDLTTVYLKGYANAEEKYKKRIKELEEALLKVKDKNTTLFIACRNSIPKQKVKNILQKNRNELFSITYLEPKQYEPYEKQIERINKIETELLEGE